MRYFCFVMVMFLSAGHCQSQNAADEQQILKIEQALNDALPGDSLTWKNYLDPQWYITTEDGSGQSRTEFLKGFHTFPAGVSGSIKVTKPVFSFHGDIAVVHYVADEYENYYGQKLHTTYAAANTWYKSGSSWMFLSSQVFEIPQSPPSIKIANESLKSFAGTYVLNDKNIAVVSVQNDTLFIQKNSKPKQALFPESSNIFFTRSDARGRKLFAKNGSGEMIMAERRNGQDVVWKRKP